MGTWIHHYSKVFDNFKEYIDGKMKASTVGLGIEFGPSIRAELTPSEKASGLSRVGASMSLPPLFSRSWSNTNDIDNIERHCGLKICKKCAIFGGFQNQNIAFV